MKYLLFNKKNTLIDKIYLKFFKKIWIYFTYIVLNIKNFCDKYDLFYILFINLSYVKQNRGY